MSPIAPKSPEKQLLLAIQSAQNILARRVEPGGGPDDKATIDALLTVLDDQEVVQAVLDLDRKLASPPTMPIEVYHGHVLDPEQLEALRLQIERETIDEVDPELRGIIERNWPNLAAKLPPEDS